MKRAAAALRDAEVPYILGGGLAAWARGGPPTEHDVDFFVRARGRRARARGARRRRDEARAAAGRLAAEGLGRGHADRPDLPPRRRRDRRRLLRACRGDRGGRSDGAGRVARRRVDDEAARAERAGSRPRPPCSSSHARCASRSTGTSSASARPARRSHAPSSRWSRSSASSSPAAAGSRTAAERSATHLTALKAFTSPGAVEAVPRSAGALGQELVEPRPRVVDALRARQRLGRALEERRERRGLQARVRRERERRDTGRVRAGHRRALHVAPAVHPRHRVDRGREDGVGGRRDGRVRLARVASRGGDVDDALTVRRVVALQPLRADRGDGDDARRLGRQVEAGAVDLARLDRRAAVVRAAARR